MADVDDPGGSSGNSAEQSKREGSRPQSDLLRGVVALSLTAPLIQACTSGDVAAVVNLVTERRAPTSEQDEESGLTPLVAACEAGHIEVVKYLIEREGVGPEQAARDGTTPLHAAARGGHMEVIKYLIDEKRVNSDCKDEKGSTPLDCALSNEIKKLLLQGKSDTYALKHVIKVGDLSLVKYLVEEQHVDPNTCADEDKRTPLHWASEHGCVEIIRYFVEVQHIDPKTCKTINDEGPLFIASANGHLDIVRYFVEKQHIDPKTCKTFDKEDPLSVASANGHLDIVRYFVEEQHIDPKTCGNLNDEGPLFIASANGHLDIVRYFVEKQHIDPKTCKNFVKEDPLFVASAYGHLDIVRYFVEEQQIDPKTCKDFVGEDPLSTASKNGHLDIVRYFVEGQHIDPKTCDVGPLFIASANGHLDIVRYFVEEQHIDPKTCKNFVKEDPLFVASAYGHLDIVRYFIEEQHIDPNTRRYRHHHTLLHVASRCGHLNVVKYFVEEKHIDPNIGDIDNDTPLHKASSKGHLIIIRYFLEERGCDSECKSDSGNTLLHDAAGYDHLDVVKYLIKDRHCNPLCRDQRGAMPLHCACRAGSLEVVKFLIEDRKVDPSCQDNNGLTPLHMAAWLGNLNIVQYLIEEQQCESDIDKYEDTPLMLATKGNHFDVVQYLISKRGCNSTVRDKNGATLLHLICDNKDPNCQMVKYLIEHGNINPSCQDENGFTPLHNAAKNGNLSVVKLLVEEYMCDPAVQDKNGQTPAEIAGELNNYTDVESYLESIEMLASTRLRRGLVEQLKPYTRRAKPTGTVLGSGTYGKVIELISAREIVAGKIFNYSNAALQQGKVNEICGEVIMMLQLQHTNIVQCKGVSLLVDHPLPVLLMERLKTSLHDYLLQHQDLPVERKVSILLDTASGLEYLHSRTPAIIHRDLTAKNVLLDSELRAKITDFGNSRIMDLDPESTPETLTSLPGTLEYMPPEAFGSNPSLDVFSFGHLSLFTITQTPVTPLLPPNYTDITTGKLCARSEVKRRETYVRSAEQLLSEIPSLVAVIKQCLHNHPAQRPRTGELVTKLSKIIISSANKNSSSDKRGDSEVETKRGEVETDNSHTEERTIANSVVLEHDTLQYRAVLEKLVPLVRTIEATPGSLKALQQHFIAKSWLDPITKTNANGLALLALNRIKTNVKDYDVFMGMLSSVTGMDQIVIIIKEHTHLSSQRRRSDGHSDTKYCTSNLDRGVKRAAHSACPPAKKSRLSSDLVAGCDTPQYRAVLDNLVTLVKAIEATPGSLENLQTLFKAKSWLGPIAKPDANDLAILALNKIENNVKTCDMFTEILSSVTGMKQIVDIIKAAGSTPTGASPAH